ncbi:MAG: hypothetical protein M1821_005951 [Bathelium mastoideum]|nr:MAG: hypothetical protein M1821_005951 [Bathelium mastoideum]
MPEARYVKPCRCSALSFFTLANNPLRHYSYECKASAQERPYVARPSRTQQLMNPKLVPRLASDVPNELTRKKGVADERLAQIAASRSRKRSRSLDDSDHRSPSPSHRQRSRSTSASSTTSVSTISTRSSRSRTPRRRRRSPPEPDRYLTSQRSDDIPFPALAPHRDYDQHANRKRQRHSTSSISSSFSRPSSTDRYKGTREPSRERGDRNTRRRRASQSPVRRGRARSRSVSQRRRQRRASNVEEGRRGRVERWRSDSDERHEDGNHGERREGVSGDRLGKGREEAMGRRDGVVGRAGKGYAPAIRQKQRSLSPYSRRLALTQAMSRGGG